MGHCEMLLAVAGMSEQQVGERASQLADGEWSEFPPAERAAFAFARKLTAEPWTVTDADRTELERVFGPHRALDVIWHVAWGNYMTRIADAFQLPLERKNVFSRPTTNSSPLTKARK
jgi:hypothetical protein